MILFRSLCDPLTKNHLDIIHGLHHTYHQDIYVVATQPLHPIIDRLNQSWLKGLSYVHYGQTPSSIGLTIEDDASLIQAMETIQNGDYHGLPMWYIRYLNRSMVYYDQMLKHYLKPSRYAHTYRVASLAIDLAKSHSVDVVKTKQTALLHDIAKNMDDDRLQSLTQQYDPTCLYQPKPIWHQYAGAIFIQTFLGITDRQIVNAIANHTTGHVVSPLARIIYIADKCDPGRDYDSSCLIALSKRDLTKGFLTVQKESEAYVARQHDQSTNP